MLIFAFDFEFAKSFFAERMTKLLILSLLLGTALAEGFGELL